MSTCVQEKFGGTGSFFFLCVWNRNKFDIFLNKYGNSFAGVNFLNDSILFKFLHCLDIGLNFCFLIFFVLFCF